MASGGQTWEETGGEGLENDGQAVAFGVIIGSVIFALTGEAFWLAIGIGIGAALGAGAQKKRR